MTAASPMRVVLAVAIAGAATLLPGCAERDRSNPLDPQNTVTGGLIIGFNALAGEGQVEIRWTRLTQSGVRGYRVLRARQGVPFRDLTGLLGPTLAGAIDSTVSNDVTYFYRLVAHLATGDSALSPPDTAIPGSRKIAVLSAGVPALVALTPDARDALFTQAASEPYEDMELDRTRAVLWLTLPGGGRVLRRGFDGTTKGPTLAVTGPADVSISELRGMGWVAVPSRGQALRFGPALDNTVPLVLPSVGEAHVVEAGSHDPSVWIGNEGGTVLRFDTDQDLLGNWSLGAPVGAIALDETRERAWVVARGAGGDDLYVIDGRDSTVVLARSGLLRVADLAFDPDSRSLWVSERGTPLAGAGRLTRATEDGAVVMTLTGIEPFGIDIDAATGSCWVTDLKSDRLLEVASNGAIARWSIRVDVPYGVRVGTAPGGGP